MSSSLSSSSSSPTQSSPSQQVTTTTGGGSTGPSSTLYLFTFLATLFVLLFVSTAIVFRSFYLRRRFRRRVDEAIAAGTFIPPGASAPGSRKYLDKPKLWDATLFPAARGEWAYIVPVTARIAVRRPGCGNASPPSLASQEPTSLRTVLPESNFLRRVFVHASATPSTAPSPLAQDVGSDPVSPFSGEQESDALSQVAQLQVSLLIAMPNPRHSHALDGAEQGTSPKGKEKRLREFWDEEEEGVPDVVIGIAEVPYNDDGDDDSDSGHRPWR
ncbi:hypothetical protein BKA93DRAFT_818255 [Sparassis latifolia]|uniref:Uncharacterized protein n=1 Tax=Sparassis crispa TaxID=139825 RepID=A0A401GS03_9APHY|nr:hypothetical protein SCP_0701210 [Sparassis crispa]GBE84939.1 hypothetical protein SCP_0701210 [Sparassis crispa]